jgi:hypothetical protein
MAGRSRSSFNKRLKERSRQGKAREKQEKKVQKKLGKEDGSPEVDDLSSIDFAAAQDQLALPGGSIEESVEE